ncbi:hypothetical protein DENSPDRAFT_817630 [Dentipellis sp. KUC8613]|nr:hypothetical protein DENSPDRAFT_817630 [Dentipellis sp. KUC8613]
MSRLTLIVAATTANGIGKNAGLPWRLPNEMAYFARTTTRAPDGAANAVIMGRNTWESIPQRFRPLPGRVNVVVSRNPAYALGGEKTETVLSPDLPAALALLADPATRPRPIHRQFVIGGAALYREALALRAAAPDAPFVDRILLTRILAPAFEDCDVHMPDFLAGSDAEDAVAWRRASHEELQAWVGGEVSQGMQEEKGVQYEFQMWVRCE